LAGFGVEFFGADAANDAVGVTEITETFEGFEEEGFSDACATSGFSNSRGAKVATVGGFVASEAEDFFVASGDEDGEGLAGEGDFSFADPFGREVLSDPVGDEVAFVGAGAADNDALVFDFFVEGGDVAKGVDVIEADEHVDHEAIFDC